MGTLLVERPRVRRARRRRGPSVLGTLAVATALALNLPLLYLFVRASSGGWGGYFETIASPFTLALLGRTLALAAGVLAGSLLVALPLAWLVTRTDLPGRRVWAVMAALPLVFPSYVAAFTWVAAFGPRGYLQTLLAGAGVERLPGLVYGYPGALLVLTLFTYPYTYLLLVAAIRGLDPALEESARSLGASRSRVFRTVVLPQLTPALAGGSLLVVLYTLSDFGAVSIVRFNTFTLAIYNAYRGLLDRGTAASLASVLVLLTLTFIFLEMLWLRRLRPAPARVSRPVRPRPLGRWTGLALMLPVVVTGAAVVTPVAVVLFWGLRAVSFGNPLGGVGPAALVSVGVSLAAAVAAVTLAVPPAVWAERRGGPLARIVERLCNAGYALPGLVVALALVFFVARALPALYQTLPLLVAAYVIRFLPQALAAVRSSLVAVSPAFEEAAASLGRRPFHVLRTLILPLVRPGLLAGGGLVFLTAMKELPATLILRPTGMETLATVIWSAASEGILSQAALPALLLLATSAVPMYALVIRPALAERSVS